MRRVLVVAAVQVAALIGCAESLAAGWTLVPVAAPAGAISTELDSVSCITLAGCTAVGHWVGPARLGVTLAELWDGTAWRPEPTPSLSDAVGGSVLEGVSCPVAGSCLAVGSYETSPTSSRPTLTLALRRDRGGWRISAPVNPSRAGIDTLWGVSCPSRSTCTAVGYVSDGAATTPLAERWRNGVWTVEPVPSPPGSLVAALDAVSCPTVDTCTAVGDVVGASGFNGGLVERWSQGLWKVVSLPAIAPGTSAALRGVSCPSARVCVAVGYSTPATGGEHALSEHYDGRSWQTAPVPEPPGTLGSDLEDVSCAAPGDCEATGGASGLFGMSNTGLAEHWDGVAWTSQATPTPPGALVPFLAGGVSCPARSGCLATGTAQTPTTQFAFSAAYTAAP